MRKLLGILCACLTLTTYSQEYDDLYYTVTDYTQLEESDTISTTPTTHNTYHYYSEYPSYRSRLKRFHSSFLYLSYWSFNNMWWSSYYYPYHYWRGYWHNPYGYYGWNQNNWYLSHRRATPTYYGPHYRKGGTPKYSPNISKVKSRPVSPQVVKKRPPITRNVRSSVYTTKVINKNISHRPVRSRTTPIRSHSTYKRPPTSFTPRNKSLSRPRTSPSTKNYSRPRPR